MFIFVCFYTEVTILLNLYEKKAINIKDCKSKNKSFKSLFLIYCILLKSEKSLELGGVTKTFPSELLTHQIEKENEKELLRQCRTGSVPCDRGVGEGIREADLRAHQCER